MLYINTDVSLSSKIFFWGHFDGIEGDNSNLSNPSSCLCHALPCLRWLCHTSQQTRTWAHYIPSFCLFTLISARYVCFPKSGFVQCILCVWRFSLYSNPIWGTSLFLLKIYRKVLFCFHYPFLPHELCPPRSLGQVWLRTMRTATRASGNWGFYRKKGKLTCFTCGQDISRCLWFSIEFMTSTLNSV